jgi:4-hydroxy-3-methylbut-2-enyl diphosphate reductase
LSTQNLNSRNLIHHPEFSIEINNQSGFCFGVVNAIKKAEENLSTDEKLYCIGSIVHNSQEVSRLSEKGLEIINIAQVKNLANKNILFRAHGEPPESYDILKQSDNKLIDATCPVVLKIQQRIKAAYINSKKNDGQIALLGKKNHAEVIGLIGQTDNNAILIETENDLKKLDFSKPIELFSQTTKSLAEFQNIKKRIEIQAKNSFKANDTICRQVSNRQTHLKEFSKKFDAVFFVGDLKSSNSKVLYQECKRANENSFFIVSPSDINAATLKNATSIGICGATSTPQWLMEDVAKAIEQLKLS